MPGEHCHARRERSSGQHSDDRKLWQQPQVQRQPLSADDAPFMGDPDRKPAVNKDDGGKEGRRLTEALRTAKSPYRDEGRHIVKQLAQIVGTIQIQNLIHKQVRRIENTGLTFGMHWITVPCAVIPERERSPSPCVLKHLLLRKIVGVNVAANEPSDISPSPPKISTSDDHRQNDTRKDAVPHSETMVSDLDRHRPPRGGRESEAMSWHPHQIHESRAHDSILFDKSQMIRSCLISIMGISRVKHDIQADVEILVIDWPRVLRCEGARSEENHTGMILQVSMTGIHQILNRLRRSVFQSKKNNV